MSAQRFDVIIAGGGLAGSAVAAAMGEFGYRVLIVEPGLDNTKRLAGELIHPPGVADLEALGLLGALERAGGAKALGFAVFASNPVANKPGEFAARDDDEGIDPSGAFVLPYAEVKGMRNQGYALEHCDIAGALLEDVESRDHVTVWRGARVTKLNLDHKDYAEITISRGKQQEITLRTAMFVAADGRTSNLRKLAGIADKRERISTMVGYVLENGRLPHPGFGHVFVDGPSPALAYQISPSEVRVMFDIRDNADGVKALERDPAYLEMLPEPLRSDVRHAMATQQQLVSANFSITPDTVVKGRMVLVGDAGGCCHPLTATGISVCTADAMRLAQALREMEGEVPSALRRYATLREGPQRTRVSLAEALYNCFADPSPSMRLLRVGMLRYWRQSKSGRAASMALLSTHEGRMSVMAKQYARVVGFSMLELVRTEERRQALKGLAQATGKYVAEAARGFIDGIFVPHSPADARRFVRAAVFGVSK